MPSARGEHDDGHEAAFGHGDDGSGEDCLRYWIKCSGTSQQPLDVDDWRPRRRGWQRDQGPVSAFPRRPRIERGDRLVNYAVGSARAFGAGRIYLVEEVVSEEPEPGGHERWPWVVQVTEVVSVPRLSLAPELRDIGVSPRSLSRHSHIGLSLESGRLAERLIREAGDDAVRVDLTGQVHVPRSVAGRG